jgi:hypothetical protein
MIKIVPAILLLLLTVHGFAQTGKDTVVYNLPTVNGHLVYTDSVTVKGHSKARLDTAAKQWFNSYFKYHQPDTLFNDKDPNRVVFSRAALQFRMATTSLALVKYNFYLIMVIKIDCKDGYYSYKIFDIYFIPGSALFRTIGYYQSSPDYLIDLYKRKHLGFEASIDMGRKKIREYLTQTNDAIRASIASLNKAMAN